MSIVRVLLVLAVLLGIGFWWLFLEGSAPPAAANTFDIARYRALVAADPNMRPHELRIETTGTDEAPGFAAETGNFGATFHTAYTSLQVIWSQRQMVIGGAVDGLTSKEMAQSEATAGFDQAAYDRTLAAMLAADSVMITHEHPDHVMAIARHPQPELLAPRLLLNEQQLAGLAQFAIGGKLAPEIAASTVLAYGDPLLVAPGVVVARAAGHSPGSQVFFVSLQNGTEYLLIGDIVWTMSNIDRLQTRPRMLQYLLFDPDEQRDLVLRQVRALHDLQQNEPELVLVPSHDRRWLERLVELGKLKQGFAL